MDLYLINGGRVPVNFQKDAGAIPSYPAFPGGNARKFQNEKATLFIKEFISGLFSIRYKIFRFSEQQKIESVSESTGIHSRVMLRNHLQLYINSTEAFHQLEGTVALFSGHISACSAIMEAGVEYRSLDIYAGNDLASQLTHFFPELNISENKVRNLLPFSFFISPALHKVIDEILDCPYDERTSHFYFDVKVREYFYLLLKEGTSINEIRYRFTPFELDRLVQAREILLYDLSKPPLTLRELARQAGINESKLKSGFHHFFKTGVFECFQRARMYKAKQLLLQTDKPIKEICTLAGYPRMTNFITAFRKFFGCTPGSLRRK